MESGVGVVKRGFERIDVGEKGSEIVNGHDEVLVVSTANVFDLGFLCLGEVFEEVEKGFRFAGGEGFADEGAEVFAVADGGGEEELVLLVGGVAVLRRRSDFPAGFDRVHFDLTVL